MQGLIRNPKDFWSGALFLALGLGFLIIGQDYSFGTARRMGPAFFPTVLAAILCVIGVAVIVRGLLTRGEPITGFALKGLVLVTVSCIAFAVTVRGAGLVASVALLTLISAIASVHFKLKATIIMMVVLGAFCALVFVKALGLPIPILGPWLGGN
ncbi:tripartite tricarboxylate transporter TctB family protein [Ferrovibrio sp.]|uniref:tripartite tricarboxylate transporter TctB family protein n=1 Tax=Ferrovibrio sp. TaxID=1917215 RepID=UPI003D2BC568